MNENRYGRWYWIGLLPVLGFALIPSMVKAGDFDFSLSHSGGYAHRLADGAYAGEYGAWTERMGFKQDDEAGGNGDAEERVGSTGDETGTDPRDFSSKLMPYYRYDELKNGVKSHSLVLFGMYAISAEMAITYEVPLKYIDYDDVLPESPFGGPLPGGPALPGFGTGGSDFDPDGDEFGLGDANFRFFYKPKSWGRSFKAPFGPKPELTTSWIFGAEVTVPTHTDDVLGDDVVVLSPMVVFVIDTPTMGFFAMMNFFDFGVYRDNDEKYVQRYRGRWFLMQPLSKPGPGLFDGIYLLPEFQPIYDMHENHFSFWVGPEFGKILAPGRIVYVKPGWGVDPEDGDREFTFEVGFRFFF